MIWCLCICDAATALLLHYFSRSVYLIRFIGFSKKNNMRCTIHTAHSTQYGSHMLHILHSVMYFNFLIALQEYLVFRCHICVPLLCTWDSMLRIGCRCAFFNLTCCMTFVWHDSSSLTTNSRRQTLKRKKNTEHFFLCYRQQCLGLFSP